MSEPRRDERWRSAFAAHHEDLAGEEHPSPEALWALAAGEMVAPESRRVVDHVSRCPACAEDLRATRDLVAQSGVASSVASDAARRRSPMQEAAVPKRARRAVPSSWAQGLAVAAVLVLAVTGWLWTSRDSGTTMRQGGQPEVRSLVEDVELARTAAVLRWTLPEELAADEARYDVVVTTEDLVPIAEARSLTEPELRLPPEDLANLRRGAVLLWRVEAALPDGTRVSSPAFRSPLADSNGDE